MKNFTQKMRSTGICLITAAAIALPGIGHAGWFRNSQPVKKITQAAKATPGNVTNKVSDISKKINEISAQLAESRPLAEVMKNGQMMGQLTEVMQFLNESQRDYQDFAASGADSMRQDIKGLVDSVTGVTDVLAMDSKMTDQLQKAADLVDKMPATFLYPLFKAGISAKITEISDRFVQLRDDLVLVATLPLERNAYLYPESYKAELCPLVSDPQTKLQLAVLGAKLDAIAWQNETIGDFMPEDLTINVTVVGGGGATVAKFPAQYVFKTIKTVVGFIKLRISNYQSIAGAMC